MRVLVTGGAGFIGSHTVDKLVNHGAEVVIVDDLSTGNEENLNPAANFVRLDIASERLSDVFIQYKPDFVIHLAAQVSVPKSLTNPVQDCMTNIIGCINLLENCRNHGINKVVYASSAAVYGSPADEVLSEGTATLPLSCYGVSKLTPEYYLKAYNHLYGINYTVLRYANVFGPRQDAMGEGGVVSIFATKILNKQAPTIFGDGEQTRDFIYVEDVAQANVKALSSGDNMILNVGTGKRTSINELFFAMSEISGITLEPVYVAAREGDIKHSCMNIGNILRNLDWQSQFSLTAGLIKTIDFYIDILN